MRSAPTPRIADLPHRDNRDPDERGPGTDRRSGGTEDDAIERDVRAELDLTEAVAAAGSIRIAVRDGVVYLTGLADSYAQKWACERAASRVGGVKVVRDHLDVHPAEGRRRDDRQIEQAARSAHSWDARVPDGVRARVTDGVLRLEGTVGRFAERAAAEEAVRNLIGLRDIVNEIKLAPVPVPADVERQVEAALRRRFRGETAGIAITATDGVITLRGVVPALALVEDLERTVRSISGVRRVDALLLVASNMKAARDLRPPGGERSFVPR
jgi:osmotically-inducible protein OsmY